MSWAADQREIVVRVLRHARHALAVKAYREVERYPLRNGAPFEPLHHHAYPRSWGPLKQKLRSATDA